MYPDLPSFPLMLLFQDPTQETTLHLIMSPEAPVSQTSLTLDDLVGFEEYWSSVLENVPRLGVCLMFFS